MPRSPTGGHPPSSGHVIRPITATCKQMLDLPSWCYGRCPADPAALGPDATTALERRGIPRSTRTRGWTRASASPRSQGQTRDPLRSDNTLTQKRLLVQSQYRPLKPAGQHPDPRPCRVAQVRLPRLRERRCPILGADLGRELPTAGAPQAARRKPGRDWARAAESIVRDQDSVPAAPDAAPEAMTVAWGKSLCQRVA